MFIATSSPEACILQLSSLSSSSSSKILVSSFIEPISLGLSDIFLHGTGFGEEYHRGEMHTSLNGFKGDNATHMTKDTVWLYIPIIFHTVFIAILADVINDINFHNPSKVLFVCFSTIKLLFILPHIYWLEAIKQEVIQPCFLE